MTFGKIVAGVVLVVVVALGVYLLDIDQTEEGSFPSVSIEEGSLPEYDAEVGDVDVGERDVTLPTLDVEPPGEDSGASN